MTRFLTTLATIWRLAIPYFRSEDRWPGRLLLGAIVSMELAVVGLSVLINQWNARFYNALQDRNWDNFVSELLFFCMLAAIYIVVRVYQLYLNQWLQIRWRRWMTQRYVGQWLDGANHYRMQMLGDSADNPDQRIAEDIRQFIDGSNGVGILPIGLGLLNAIVTLVSFVIILWGLSQAAPLTVYGWTIPGYLVWAALAYAAAGTLFTHLIGRPLIRLNFDQQRYEADFRFNLVRVRENSEQIALLHGETAERGRLMDRFHAVMDNWLQIMTRQKRLTFLTASYGQASVVFPIIVVSPAYFAGRIQLGALTQTASAFNSVQGALSFFVDSYVRIAEWRAVIERLAGFNVSIANAQECTARAPSIAVTAAPVRDVELENVEVALPSGQPLVAADMAFVPHQDVLLTGPSGLRQVHAVPRDGGHLAVRQGHRHGAARRESDDIAAAALPADRHARSRDQLSIRAGYVRCRSHPRSSGRGRAACDDGAARGARALEPDAVARRATTARHRARDPACAGLPVPRRSDRLARRVGRSEGVQAAQGSSAQRDDHLDWPPLHAGRLPQARHHAGARRRALSGTRCGAQRRGGLI